MSSVQIQGNASGAGVFTIASPNSASSYTATLPTATTTLVGTDAAQTLTNKTLGSGLVAGASLITSGTSVASTSGTSIDFTSIPSWVKRITVMFYGVSTSGTSVKQIQLGTGSTTYTTTGYVGATGYATTAVTPLSVTTGFGLQTGGTATELNSGLIVIANITGNNWVCSGTVSTTGAAQPGLIYTNGQISLGAVLTAVRITTVNGTDTFDAGSINILYE